MMRLRKMSMWREGRAAGLLFLQPRWSTYSSLLYVCIRIAKHEVSNLTRQPPCFFPNAQRQTWTNTSTCRDWKSKRMRHLPQHTPKEKKSQMKSITIQNNKLYFKTIASLHDSTARHVAFQPRNLRRTLGDDYHSTNDTHDPEKTNTRPTPCSGRREQLPQ